MITKTEQVKQAAKRQDYKQALKMAKGFKINVTADQRDAMSRAYECIVHPDFYRQIGVDVERSIDIGKEVLIKLFA